MTIKWPAVMTASKWSTTFDQLWQVARKNGDYAPGGSLSPLPSTIVPKLTNGDVVRIIMAWLAELGSAQTRQLFPLWPQFAAVAYKWNPDNGDKLITTQAQRDKWYPSAMLVELWLAMFDMARKLDMTKAGTARLYMDGSFSDPVFQGEVKAQLAQDGAAHTEGFKFPVGCKHKDGKVSPVPKCTKRSPQWPYWCIEWDCDPYYVDIDPVKTIKKQFTQAGWLIILVGAFWLLFDNKPRSRRPAR